MALQRIAEVRGRAVYLPGDDIDTDRIIPARYLKVVTFEGLGEALFHDVRFDETGGAKDHPLNDPRFEGASILISGSNFGCGSSREHAPQAIYRAGFQAVVATSFAEIFFSNSTTLGIPCVAVQDDDLAPLAASVETDPGAELRIDLEAMELHAGGHRFALDMPATAREGLLQGRWDPLAELLEGSTTVATIATRLGYLPQV